MQFKTIIATALSLASIVQGAAVARSTLDVFVPKILDPHTGTVWTIGKVETVRWDTSNAPVNISNAAAIDLHGPVGQPVNRLAQGFDLRSGSIAVTVPTNIIPGPYTITLFGDSGNISPQFTIQA